jgi:hypothetical protein
MKGASLCSEPVCAHLASKMLESGNEVKYNMFQNISWDTKNAEFMLISNMVKNCRQVLKKVMKQNIL